LTSHATPPHPSAYLFLIAPFGIVNGYVSVALGYVLAQGGVNAQGVAALVAVYFLPQTWKFIWAPVADLTLTRRCWHVIAASLCALSLVSLGIAPVQADMLPLLSALAFLASLSTTFLAMSVESLMAYGVPDSQKGRASGWFQAGNLGGTGLGGGAGLWMAQHLPPAWISAAVLGAACLACSAALLYVPEPARARRGDTIGEAIRNVLRDLWGLARQRESLLALLICFLPIGTGAASNLWAAIASDWHASGDTVALVTGILGGIASAAGCLVGGYLCDRMDRKVAYLVFGLAQALCAVAMAWAPRTQAMYVVFVIVYWFVSGLTYAAFSAVVLEAIGMGAAATKYNVFASLSNTPIAYMTLVDGWAHTQWGAAAMLHAEALVGIAAMSLFVAVAAVAKRRRPTPA
jgi:MFS transporter, PAT family, beta-lactamase induction signal transducer AmpG